MKKFILFLFLTFVSLFGYSQTYYKATITEMHTYNTQREEWELYQKHSDVNITVVIEEEFISFQAKTPTMYKIYLDTKEPISTKTLRGFRYIAKDLKQETTVKIDVMVSEESQLALVSIINAKEGYNLRFVLTKVIE